MRAGRGFSGDALQFLSNLRKIILANANTPRRMSAVVAAARREDGLCTLMHTRRLWVMRGRVPHQCLQGASS
jgi:hypothetical protein